AYDGVLRGAPPNRSDAAADGGDAWPRAASCAVPGADEDLRGGRARDASRPARPGGGGSQGRDRRRRCGKTRRGTRAGGPRCARAGKDRGGGADEGGGGRGCEGNRGAPAQLV